MTELLLVTGIFLLAVISPGPDFVMILRNSISYSRRVALLTALGIGLGIMFHITYSLFGIGLIISQSVLLFNVIKYFGAAYLIYLGIQSLQSKKSDTNLKIETEAKKDMSDLKALRVGFLTNVLNPKATLFFLALFTQILNPATSVFTKLAYGFEMVLITITWFSLVAIFLTNSKLRKQFIGVKHYFEKVFGGLLVGLGIKVALSSNR